MSSTLVEYPVQIKSYQVQIRRGTADIQLEGVEEGRSEPQRVGHMTFGDPDPIGKDADFITRGGFLQMDRPLEMLSAVLDLLRHESPLFLNADGTLSTSLERAGEEERRTRSA
jgi:hypothetical protein